MEHQVKTPYGIVTFMNECPPERVQEVLAQYASKIGFLEKRNASGNQKSSLLASDSGKVLK